MLRYLRLYLYFLRFSFSRAMEFRLDFFFRIVMDCLFYVIQIIFFWTIFRHTPLLGGWDFDQVLIFASGVMFMDAVFMTVYSNNTWWLPISINRGDLDYYLVRPVSSFFFLTMRDFAANSFMNLVIASGILGYMLWRYPGPIGALNTVLFVLLLLAGTWIYFLFQMCFLIPAFWMHSISGLREISWHLVKYSERPHQIYTGWLKRILLTVIPLALVVSYPTHVLFEGPSVERIGHIFVVGILLTALVLWFWGRGLRGYSSASS